MPISKKGKWSYATQNGFKNRNKSKGVEVSEIYGVVKIEYYVANSLKYSETSVGAGFHNKGLKISDVEEAPISIKPDAKGPHRINTIKEVWERKDVIISHEWWLN